MLQIETTKIHGHTVHNTSSFEGFQKWVDLVKDKTETTIFRGQRKDYPLLPNICRSTERLDRSIERPDPNKERQKLLENEREMFRLFKKEADPCLQVSPENDWEWLAVAQHHGLLTRLLDWSFDPYVALWFALEKALSVKDSRPEVWVMSPLSTDVIENLDNSLPFSGTRTKVFKSNFQIPRITAQKGCFVLFKYTENSKDGFVPIERNIKLRSRVSRVRVQLHSVAKILRRLEQMGYTEKTIYPDIDKVARDVLNTIKNRVR